jgi:hypothetical protein
MFVGPAVIAFVVALIALFGPFVSDEIEFRRKLRIAQQKARLAIEQRDLEEQPERRRLEEQLPRASEGVAYLLEQMLAAEGDPNATSQQKKEWRALFHKAKIEYEKLRQSGRILGVAPHYSRSLFRTREPRSSGCNDASIFELRFPEMIIFSSLPRREYETLCGSASTTGSTASRV